MRITKFPFVVTLILLVLLPALAFAGTLDAVKSWFTQGAVLAVLSFVLGLGIIVAWTNWLSVMGTAFGYLLISAGQVIVTGSLAILDHKITVDEAKAVGADIQAAKERFAGFIAAARERPGKPMPPG